MSYRDKRSRIVFAITATFVIFGSTASNALPPEAITEEVKSVQSYFQWSATAQMLRRSFCGQAQSAECSGQVSE